jgi:hypothetical protein
LKNTDGELNRTLGLEISSVFKDRVVVSTSSSNLGRAGEANCCLVVVIIGTAVTLESMVVLGEGSGRRDGSPMEEINTLLFSSVNQTYMAWEAHGVVGDTIAIGAGDLLSYCWIEVEGGIPFVKCLNPDTQR